MARLCGIDTDNRLLLSIEDAERAAVRQVGECVLIGGAWRVPFSAEKVTELQNVFGEKLLIDDSVFEGLKKLNQKWQDLQDIKDGKVSLKDWNHYLTATSITPYPHQIVALDWLVSIYDVYHHTGACLFDAMGLGKTATALWFAEYLIRNKQIERVVAFVPKTVVLKWGEETKKCTGLKPQCVFGTKEQRKKQLDRKADIYIMNPDAGLMFDDWIAAHARQQYVIVDEAHVLRVPYPRTQFCNLVSGLQAKFLLLMTGTPIYGKLFHLFNQLQLTLRPWQNWLTFQQQHMETVNRYGRQLIRYKKKKELEVIASRGSIRRMQDEVLDLPPQIEENRILQIYGQHKRAYEAMRDSLVYEWSKLPDEYFRRNAAHVRAQLTRLSQIVDGFLSDSKNIEWLDDNCKCDELDDIVENTIYGACKKLVVWCHFIPSVLRIVERYAKHNPVMIHGGVNTTQRHMAQLRFRDDVKCKIFVGQIETGGIGIDLVGGKSTIEKKDAFEQANWQQRVMVFYKRAWSYGANDQALKRCRRPGQVGTLNVINLIVEGTVDEWIDRQVNAQKQEAGSVLSGLNKKTLLGGLKK